MAPRHFAKQRARGESPPYLFPSVCFTCRKSFKRPPTNQPLRCPQCSGTLVQLSRKFSTPKARQVEQWKKVRALVEAGFRFYSLYEADAEGRRNSRISYPRRLSEVGDFIARYSCLLNQSAQTSPPASLSKRVRAVESDA